MGIEVHGNVSLSIAKLNFDSSEKKKKGRKRGKGKMESLKFEMRPAINYRFSKGKAGSSSRNRYCGSNDISLPLEANHHIRNLSNG